MRLFFTGFIFFYLIIWNSVSHALDKSGKDKREDVEKLYYSALKLESKQKYKKALNFYSLIINYYSDEKYTKESFFRMAAINDEKMLNPVKAVKYYNRYLKSGGGRYSFRALGRIKILTPYLEIDLEKYREYITILNKDSLNNHEKTIKDMETFIKNSPNYKRLDDAIFWLANEKKGFHRGVLNKKHEKDIREAIFLYKRIVNEFKDSAYKTPVLKNIGDCHKMLGEKDKAELYYKMASGTGESSKILIDDYRPTNRIEIVEKKILLAAITSILLMLPVIIFFSYPGKERFIKGIRKGFFNSIFYLPVPIILVLITFFATDPSMDNHTGTEPYLMMLLTAIPLFGIFIHGLREKRRKEPSVKSNILFFTASIIFFFSSVYASLYSTGYLVVVREALR